MENAEARTGLASGDTPAPLMKRDQDSTDDFEHLERDSKQEAGEPPQHAARAATHSFLEMERHSPAEGPPPPPPDHIADKFTDSESDTGESPLHRPAPRTPDPLPAHDPTPVLSPAPAPKMPEPEPTPVEIPEVKPPAEPAPPAPEPKLVAEPKPEHKPEVIPKPEAAPEPVRPQRHPTAHVIEAEVIFCKMGLVESLVYWRCAARSGAALAGGLVLLVSLACCSVVSVFSYCSLLALSVAVAFRVYKNVLQAVQKTNDGHPFKWLLEQDISVPAERAQSLAASATAHLNAALSELRRLFLVEDLVDSLKFGVLLWCLTYVGACFNGITLIILGWIALFTLPKAYEMNKAQVDANLELARAKINEISAKVRAAVPLGKKTESDKDK